MQRKTVKLKSVKHSTERTFSNNSRGVRKIGEEYFYPISSNNHNSQKIDPLKAFLVPEVGSILNKRATAHSSVKLEVVSKQTKKPVINNINKLIINPNWFQSQKEFIKQTNLFRDLFGNEYIYLLFPVGFSPERTKAIYTLPPQFIDIEYKPEAKFYTESEAPDTIKYKFKANGKSTEIDSDQIIHMNDNRVNLDPSNSSLLKGTSKLDSIAMPINNIIAAYEARGVIIRNRGALGILSNDSSDGIGSTMPIDEGEKANLQNEYRNYGISGDQWQIIITNMNLKWQQMAIDFDKLKLFEEVKEDAIKVAEAFNYPPELLGKDGSPNLFGENKSASERAWYENSIIPEAQERIDALNKAFGTESKTFEIVGKFDHLPMFQDDLKAKAATMTLVTNSLSKMYQDGAITLEQYQKELSKMGYIE